MTQSYYYDAFISYRHLAGGIELTGYLQKLLETYRSPCDGKFVKKGKRIPRIFTDKSEMPLSIDLGATIRDALDQSRMLIVMASPEYTQSRWCMEELRYFLDLHGGSIDNILFVMIGNDPDTSIVQILRDAGAKGFTEDEILTEPLYADVHAESLAASKRLLRQEFLRIAAPLIGCGYDDLARRSQRRRTIRIAAAAAAVVLAVTVGVAAWQRYTRDVDALEEERDSVVAERDEAVAERDTVADYRAIEGGLSTIRAAIDSDRNITALRGMQELWAEYGDVPEYAETIETALSPSWVEANYVPAFSVIESAPCGEYGRVLLSSDEQYVLVINLIVGKLTKVSVYTALLDPVAEVELNYYFDEMVHVLGTNDGWNGYPGVCFNYDAATGEIILLDAKGRHTFDHTGVQTSLQPLTDEEAASLEYVFYEAPRDPQWGQWLARMCKNGDMYFLSGENYGEEGYEYDAFEYAYLYCMPAGSDTAVRIADFGLPEGILYYDDLYLSPDERYILAVLRNGVYETHVKIYDLERQEHVGMLKMDTGYVYDKDFHFAQTDEGTLMLITADGVMGYYISDKNASLDYVSLDAGAASFVMGANDLCYFLGGSGTLSAMTLRDISLIDFLQDCDPAASVDADIYANDFLADVPPEEMYGSSSPGMELAFHDVVMHGTSVPNRTGPGESDFVGLDLALSVKNAAGAELFTFVQTTGFAQPYCNAASRLFGFVDPDTLTFTDLYRYYTFPEYMQRLSEYFGTN